MIPLCFGKQPHFDSLQPMTVASPSHQSGVRITEDPSHCKQTKKNEATCNPESDRDTESFDSPRKKCHNSHTKECSHTEYDGGREVVVTSEG